MVILFGWDNPSIVYRMPSYRRIQRVPDILCNASAGVALSCSNVNEFKSKVVSDMPVDAIDVSTTQKTPKGNKIKTCLAFLPIVF